MESDVSHYLISAATESGDTTAEVLVSLALAIEEQTTQQERIADALERIAKRADGLNADGESEGVDAAYLADQSPDWKGY